MKTRDLLKKEKFKFYQSSCIFHDFSKNELQKEIYLYETIKSLNSGSIRIFIKWVCKRWLVPPLYCHDLDGYFFQISDK